ncbi:unnamed protein product [Blepharisma stoltei]|uniref:Uncharacterized protein n=1 Tax=Blepharisma stoltei TaxID=1481888 RepID=A0AAU9J5P4_9CILI|nr:unnamed protein product [Blepharisma stoltei]
MDELKKSTETFMMPISRCSIRSSTNICKNPGNNTKKNLDILPKLTNGKKINIFTLFALFSNSRELNINLPTTLIKSEDLPIPCLLWAKSNGILCSRFCKDNEFFIFSHKNKNCEGHTYLYKRFDKESIILNSKEAAESLWNSSTDSSAMIQTYIESPSNPKSILRVLWRSGMKSKYFTIINRIHVINNLCETQRKVSATPSLYQRKKSLSILGDFKYTDMILKTSRSINNPYKVSRFSRTMRREKTRSDKMITAKNKDEKHIEVRDFQLQDQNNMIVDPKKTDNILVLEDSIKGAELDPIVDQIVAFLNSNVYKEEEINGIVLDFVLCKMQKWVLLDCKEISVGRCKTPFENGKKVELKPLSKRRTSSYGEVLILESQRSTPKPDIKINKTPSTHSSLGCPFTIKSTPKLIPTSASEKDLFDRWNQVNERLGKIVSLKPSYVKDAKEQSIKAYQTRYNARHGTVIEPTTPSLETDSSPLTSNTQPTSNPLWDNENQHIHRCFADIIGRIDEMNMNTELLKVKHQNLVGKYGGDDFWNKFIRSLYKKIMSDESSLHKYFVGSHLDMIIGGMFKVFNGCATLEFRRKIKAAHEFMGISDKDFNLYSDFFESTLNEFEIEEEDKRVIMTQIRSMRCLICRYPQIGS